MCPFSHPYAYLNGSYCCKSNKEKISANDGSSCDGSEIKFNSTCCEENQFTRCSAESCRDHGEIVSHLLPSLIHIYSVESTTLPPETTNPISTQKQSNTTSFMLQDNSIFYSGDEISGDNNESIQMIEDHILTGTASRELLPSAQILNNALYK